MAKTKSGEADLRIEKLKKDSLEAFVKSDAFTQMEHIPISRHRAVSQTKNPQAREDDILLLIAWEDEKLLGYLGLLPGDFHSGDKPFHCAWMSTIWVHPDARGKGVARSLLDAAMGAYEGRILGTDFTAEAKAIYLKTGHFDLLEKYAGLRLYYRFNLSRLLPPKNGLFRRIKFLLQLADPVLNFLMAMRPVFKAKSPDTGIKEFSEWSAEHKEFIRRFGRNSPTPRNSAALNWIIKNPWVLESEQTDELGKRYHFTSAEKRAYYQSLEIKKNGKRIALLLLFIRNDALKIPYAFIDTEETYSVCAELDRIMKDKKLSLLTVFHPELKSAFSTMKTRAFHKRTIVREYVIGIPFHQEIDRTRQGHFQDGDGDCAFT